MGIAAILGLVTQLVPLATQMINTIISVSGGTAGKTGEILDFIARLTPIAQGLVERIEEIRNATEDEYPEVWANVRTDWMATRAEWLKLNPTV